ncbi:hypothetical protein B0H21DRAFT_708952 [Amylocystis lapponica]|nr:hypothetical protein B0H21DRAFT_708952 [Amylocystis lapponica]
MAKKNPKSNTTGTHKTPSGPAGAAKERHNTAFGVVDDRVPPDDPDGSTRPPEVAITPADDGTPTQPTEGESRQSTPLTGLGDDSRDTPALSSRDGPIATPPGAAEREDWANTGDPADELDDLWRGTYDIISTFETRMNSADIVARRALKFSSRGLRESNTLLQSTQETREEVAMAINDLRDRLLRSRKAYGVNRPPPEIDQSRSGVGSTTPRQSHSDPEPVGTPPIRGYTPFGDEDYGDPVVDASVEQIFRDRDDGETDSEYRARLNA